MSYLIWLAIAAVLLIVEAMTVNMVTAWFAGGALVAMILSVLDLAIEVQIISFLIVSAILLALFLIVVKPRLSAKNKVVEPTNADRLIGCHGIVSSTIDNLHNSGRVEVKGQDWSAQSIDGSTITVGTEIVVKEIKGVKLIVTAL